MCLEGIPLLRRILMLLLVGTESGDVRCAALSGSCIMHYIWAGWPSADMCCLDTQAQAGGDQLLTFRQDIFESMLPQWHALLQTDLRMLVYSGDVDGILPVMPFCPLLQPIYLSDSHGAA